MEEIEIAMEKWESAQENYDKKKQANLKKASS